MTKGILVILDGYGEGKAGEYNAVINANTPTLDRLKTQSYSLLEASGEAVGLFTGDLGGSEVGHTTIGAGRVVPSTAKKINDEVNSGELAKNVALNKILDRLNNASGDLHLVGLMSDKKEKADSQNRKSAQIKYIHFPRLHSYFRFKILFLKMHLFFNFFYSKTFITSLVHTVLDITHHFLACII